MLDRMSLIFLGPDLVKAMHLSNARLGVLVAATSICWAISSLVFEALSDRIGRKKVLVPAMIAFSVFSVLSGLTNDFWQLLAVRRTAGSS